jgi:hypothetical protein
MFECYARIAFGWWQAGICQHDKKVGEALFR